ncbi:hypothetical protein [Chitinophaga pinensis]|nr:hypothetical protein [Chitinophaga pinensis]
MIRTILFTAILLSAMGVKAQVPATVGAQDSTQSFFRRPSHNTDSSFQKKWYVTKYAGLSTGFIGFKGGGGSYLSAPLALQLNKPLTNNITAFANVSAAPYLFNFNTVTRQTGLSKTNNFMQVRKLGANAAASVGVMYTNDQKTFSISGSIGVSRGSYNGYSPFYAPATFPVMGNGLQ